MSEINREALGLLIDAYGRFSKADTEQVANGYCMMVPFYGSSDDHRYIEKMVIVGDWYFGKDMFLLYDGAHLAGQFSREAVKKLWEDKQEMERLRKIIDGIDLQPSDSEDTDE